MRPVFRPDPVLPVQAMQTYGFVAEPGVHTRSATCAEVGCKAMQNGWRTTVDLSTPLGGKQANYIRLKSGRTFTVQETGNLVAFTFAAGQRCFADHQIRTDKDPTYYKVGGDWREQLGKPVIMRGVDWVDDFANHQQNVADKKKEG